jgi:hypothetical protein
MMEVRMARRAVTALTVLIVGFVGGSWATAQGVYSIRPPVQLVVVDPLVASGTDIGFRIEARRGRTPVGTLVVRTDGGAWEVAEFATRATTVTSAK